MTDKSINASDGVLKAVFRPICPVEFGRPSFIRGIRKEEPALWTRNAPAHGINPQETLETAIA